MPEQSSHGSRTMLCLNPCPPWGFCATPVTPAQAIRRVCGSKNGIHGYDGYVKDSTLASVSEGRS